MLLRLGQICRGVFKEAVSLAKMLSRLGQVSIGLETLVYLDFVGKSYALPGPWCDSTSGPIYGIEIYTIAFFAIH